MKVDVVMGDNVLKAYLGADENDVVSLRFEKEKRWDIMKVYCGKKLLFSADWFGNLRPKVERMIREIKDDC